MVVGVTPEYVSDGIITLKAWTRRTSSDRQTMLVIGVQLHKQLLDG